MNFLAHLALAGPDDASRIGNLLGDFEKGTPAHLEKQFPAPIVNGILMHRRLDRFTDDHWAFQQARNLLIPGRRRFAGIIIDIFFDHFLSRHWCQFYPGTVDEFIAGIYATFDRHPAWLGSHLGALVPRLKAENWLAAYSTREGLAKTFSRVSSRSRNLAPLLHSTDDLQRHECDLEHLFLAFYPEVRDEAKLHLNLPANPPSAFP